MISIFVYGISFGIILLSAWGYQHYEKKETYVGKINIKNFFLVFIFICPILLAGLRYDVGTDYLAYLEMYNNIKVFNPIEFWSQQVEIYQVEPLFYLLCRMIYLIYDNPIVFFAICELLIVLFIFEGIKNFNGSQDMLLSFMIFLFAFFPLTLNIIRQAIAMAIIFFAFSLFFKKRYVLTFLAIIFATGFHSTAFLFYTIFLFVKFKNEKWNRLKSIAYLFMILCTPIILKILLLVVSKIPVFDLYFRRYELNFDNGGIGFLINILPILIPCTYYGIKSNLFKSEMSPIFEIYLLQIPLSYLGYYAGWASRLSSYASTVEIILVPYILRTIKNEKEKRIIKLYFIIYYLGYFVVNFCLLGHSQMFPYKFL